MLLVAASIEFEREAGEIGTAAAAGLVPDPIEVRADGCHRDEQLSGDVLVTFTGGRRISISRSLSSIRRRRSRVACRSNAASDADM